MDKRTGAILAIVLTSLLCALPGLAGLCLGSLGLVGVNIPDFGAVLDAGEKTGAVVLLALMAGCGILGILTPVLIAVFTLRSPKKDAFFASEPPKVDPNEPLPPPG